MPETLFDLVHRPRALTLSLNLPRKKHWARWGLVREWDDGIKIRGSQRVRVHRVDHQESPTVEDDPVLAGKLHSSTTYPHRTCQ